MAGRFSIGLAGVINPLIPFPPGEGPGEGIFVGVDLGVRPNFIEWMEGLFHPRTRTCRMNPIFLHIGHWRALESALAGHSNDFPAIVPRRQFTLQFEFYG